MANKITVTSAGTVASANVTPDSAMYYSNKSKEWAISNRIVDNTDYSSKYYANESKKQADISTAKATEVITSGNNAVSNIENARDNAIIDITNQENLSVDNVNTAGATQIALATEQANIATEQATIATNKTSEIVASGNEALSNIDNAKTGALTDITNLKNTSVSNITTAKNSAISTITTQETTSKNNVIATGNEQVARIEATGNNYDNLTHKNITNCLLEVPQRIKYTLENGLTIKAGSVVIVPYGTEDKTADLPKGATFINENFKVYDTQFSDGKFFVWAELVNDTSSSFTVSDTQTRIISIAIKTNEIAGALYSVSSATPSVSKYTIVYNLSTNLIGYTHENSTIYYGEHIPSFPIMLAVANGTTPYGSISQVFNGMGYIGSTVWLDKGVKGLIPNGRNADGSLRNIEYTRSKLSLNSTFYPLTTYLQSDATGIGEVVTSRYHETETEPKSPDGWSVWSKPSENIAYLKNIGDSSSKWTPQYMQTGLAEIVRGDNGKIISFAPKLPFRAVDYNDKSEISGWSMPSNRYIDLTLGASGTTYTAPADGWASAYDFVVQTNSILAIYQVSNRGIGNRLARPSKISYADAFIPCAKGDKFKLEYGDQTGNINTPKLRFYYTVGSEPVV